MKKFTKIVIGILLLLMYIVSLISFASALVIDSVSVSNEIVPGETTRVTIILDNDGEDLRDVSVNLELKDVPFAPYDSASEYGINEIKEDKSKTAEFNLIALNNAKSGIYKIPVKIKYTDENNEVKNKESLISIVVNSKPEIDVSVEDGLLLKGQNNEISIRITNKGLSDAKFLEVEIGRLSYANILNSRKHYIGDVDSDDFDSVQLKVFFNNDVPDKIVLPVSINYKDDLNKEYKESFDLELDVYSRNKAIELGLIERNNIVLYIGLSVLLILIIILYRQLRKKAIIRKRKR